MQTTVGKPADSAGAISSRHATRQRANETRTSEPLKADKAEAGIPVTDFFKTWPRKDREALIEVLIDSLDAEAGDVDLEETGDAEPSLGFQTADIFVGRGCEHGGSGDDREVEDEHDEEGWDREDVCEDEGAEHDGSEPDDDGEPSLGWPERISQSAANTDFRGIDFEADGSYVTEAARARYKPFDRYTSNGNRDGRHVDAERGFGVASRRLTNLSDRQCVIVKPRLNSEEVRLS